jgi:AraC-like DNA-binding protein
MKQLFFKYPTVSESDIEWGLCLRVAGNATIAAGEDYPPPGHPNEYHFSWNNGRVLQEFQINYITNGCGIMETRDGVFDIEPGSLLLIFPGVWHRYRPNKETGWTEHYLGYKGDFTNNIYKHPILNPQKPVLRIGFQELVLSEFNEIFNLIAEEKPGFQQVCAGKVVYLLAKIISAIRNSEFAGKEVERTIRRACLTMRDNLQSNLNMEELAKELHIGYSYFRQMFRKYTGISPAQYHLNLRIQKSKELLISGNKSVKEIAFELGFESNQYFSRIFSEKCGMSPVKFRRKNLT